MFTTKTITLPEDPDAARAEFDHWVHHEGVVLLVVLGSGSEVERIVEDADSLANHMNDMAHVLWARHPDDLAAAFRALKAAPKLKSQIPGSQAFALSLTDRVVDVIRRDEDPPDLTRLFEAFNKALGDAGIGG